MSKDWEVAYGATCPTPPLAMFGDAEEEGENESVLRVECVTPISVRNVVRCLSTNKVNIPLQIK